MTLFPHCFSCEENNNHNIVAHTFRCGNSNNINEILTNKSQSSPRPNRGGERIGREAFLGSVFYPPYLNDYFYPRLKTWGYE